MHENRSTLAENFNNAFDNLAVILMILSFIGMSFLLISASVSLLGEFVRADAATSGWYLLFQALLFALEVALAAVFVDIHRRGVGVLVGSKNFWHFTAIIGVIAMTFQIERTSIAYGLSFIQKSFVKEDALTYRQSDAYKNAMQNKIKAESAIKKWEKYHGTKADQMLISELEEQYKKGKAEKAFRLKTYKHATTKHADKLIADAIMRLKQLEERITKEREKNIALYQKVERLAIERMEQIQNRHTQAQNNSIIHFSNQAEEWAHKVVVFMALIYFIHGVLIVVSEDEFSMREWLVRLMPIFAPKIDKFGEEAKKIAGLQEESENVIAFTPPDKIDKDDSFEQKYHMLKITVGNLLEEQLIKGGANMTGFAAVGRDKAFKKYKELVDSGHLSPGVSRNFIEKNIAHVNREMIPKYRAKLNEMKQNVG